MTVPPDKSPDRITPGKAMEPPETRIAPQPPRGDFQSHMQGAPAAPSQPAAPGGPTPLDLARQSQMQTAGPSFNSILAQAKNAQDSLGTVGDQLKTPNLKLRRSQTHLVKNKLTDANTYIRAAGSKLGIEAPPMKAHTGSTPIERFLSYVNDGQEQLLAVQQKLKDISASGEDIRPGDMMLIQVKMSQAQQEIEYSSVLLSKVIDSIKTILNTQL